MSQAIDIGHGVTIFFTEYNGVTIGLIEEHDSPSGRCSGSVFFRGRPGVLPPDLGGHPNWDVLSMEPLTLSPSIQCRTCGHHGFIREGRWVPS